jgi:AcrR family transcriptional regulator
MPDPIQRTTAENSASPVPTRERQRRETRNLILEVAIAEIAEVGLAKARIEHIARKAGVTRTTIYAHFPRKEGFLRALETRSQEFALRELEGRLGEASGPELLHGFVDAVLDLLQVAPTTLRRETFSLLLREPEHVDWETHPLFGFLTRQLALAMDRGEIAVDLPAPDFTRVVMNSLFGFLVVESEPMPVRRRAAHQMLDRLLGSTPTAGR